MKWIALSFTTCFLVTIFQVSAQNKSQKPNIIFILADDLGYGNLSSYNPKTPVPTPNIDKMAKEGTKFTRFYAGSTVCAPSRASLMTGKHMGHAYIRGNGNVSLRAQDSTLAQHMQKSGYTTGMFGKWGLGLENEPGAPQLKGFDSFYGYLLQKHAHYYFTDHLFEIQNSQLKKVKVDSSQYTQDLIVDKALSFIKENKEKPFFLYLPITLPHAELKVPKDLLKKYRNADGSSKLGPEKPFYPKGASYHTQLQPHAAFAAMIDKMDYDVGRVLHLVKELGLDENTYVFFTSDNGPHSEGGGDPMFFNAAGPLRGEKRDMYEGGIRVPMIVRAPGKVPAAKTREDIWAFWDIIPTFNELGGSKPTQNIDGLSFVKAISGKKQKEKHNYLYWQFNEGQYKEALLKENWKLIRYKEKGKPEILELYNLKADIAEKHNLIAQNPVKTNTLLALMKQAKSPAENTLFDWTELEQ